MKVSFNWLKEYLDLSITPQKVAEILTSRGLEVEAIENQSQGFEKVISAQILEKKQHPNADRLSLCKVSTGGDKVLDIVCGAQNMKAGDKVALAQVGALLPNGLKIQESKVRGELSQGMLCSEEELKLNDSSEGILILDPATILGKNLAEILGRDDTILTLKLTANRGDCLSHFGLARELGAALGQTPREPKTTKIQLQGSKIGVTCNAGQDGPQFFGYEIEGVKVGPSPQWLKTKLEAVGIRSISNIVDATNLVMMELGHPVHAYDAAQIKGKALEIRNAKAGEKIALLDTTTIECDGTELVIADEAGAVGLAGVMGGAHSEVSDKTTRVFLECAEFNPTRVRRSAQKFQKRSEASARFEKGIDPMGLERVISRLAYVVIELAGGKGVGGSQAQLQVRASKTIEIQDSYFEKILGMKVPSSDVQKILKGLGCEISATGSMFKIKAPSYRRDLEIREDFAEEIARTVGYDKIPSTVPILTGMPTSQNGDSLYNQQALLDFTKDALVDLGLSESLNFAFTSRAWLNKLKMPLGAVAAAVTSAPIVQNPLSEEHEVLVPSLLPGLIKNAVDNTRHHFGSEPLAIRLFEIRPVFSTTGEVKAGALGETGVEQKLKLAFVISGPQYQSALRNEAGQVDFYDLKAILDSVISKLAAKGVRYQASGVMAPKALGPLFHPGMSVEVLAGPGSIGTIGKLHPAFQSELKLRSELFLCEIDFSALAKLSRPAWQVPSFSPWSQFPTMERDYAFVVDRSVTAEKVLNAALKAAKSLVKRGKIFDYYQGDQVAAGKVSLAIRLFFESLDKSLTEEEVELASKAVIAAVQKETQAELR